MEEWGKGEGRRPAWVRKMDVSRKSKAARKQERVQESTGERKEKKVKPKGKRKGGRSREERKRGRSRRGIEGRVGERTGLAS